MGNRAAERSNDSVINPGSGTDEASLQRDAIISNCFVSDGAGGVFGGALCRWGEKAEEGQD